MVTLGVDTRDLKRAESEFRRFSASGQSAFSKLQSSIFNVKNAVLGLAAAFGVSKLAEYIKDVAHMAGTYDMLGITMRVAGRNAGYTAAEMDGLEKSIRKQGIAAIEARQTLTRMSAAQIDLAKASELARAAQDLAVVGHINSSEAFERLIQGIQTGHVVILRTLGLNVSFEKGYKKTARQLNKNVEALSELERVQSKTNTVLEGAIKYQGIYEQSMTSAEKQCGSLTRYVDNYKVALGAALQPAFLRLMQVKTNMFKKLTEVVSNPRLQGSIESLGLAFVRMYEAFAKGVVIFAEYGDVAISTLGTLTKIVLVRGALALGFLGLTKVIMGAVVAVQTFHLQMGLLKLELIATTGVASRSSMVWAALNTTLWGTGLAAQWATGWMTKLKMSVNLLFAAWAGWEVGKWLTKNFESARIAGVMMIDVLMRGWIHLRYGAEIAFLKIRNTWRTVINFLKSSYGSFLDFVAKGLEKIGSVKVATGLRKIANQYIVSKEEKEKVTRQYEKDLKDISTNLNEKLKAHNRIIEEMQYETIHPPVPAIPPLPEFPPLPELPPLPPVPSPVESISNQIDKYKELKQELEFQISILKETADRQKALTMLRGADVNATEGQIDEITKLIAVLRKEESARKYLEMRSELEFQISILKETADRQKALTMLRGADINATKGQIDEITKLITVLRLAEEQEKELDRIKEEQRRITEAFNEEYTKLGKSKYDIERGELDKLRGLWIEAGIEKTKIAKLYSDKAVQIARDEESAKLSIYQNMAGQVTNTFMQISQAGGKYSIAAFRMYQAFAITQAMISGYLAYVKTLAEPALPFPSNVVMAKIVAGMAAVQIAMIAAAKPPSYAEGGISWKKEMALVGEKGPEAHIPLKGGNIPVRITGSERKEKPIIVNMNVYANDADSFNSRIMQSKEVIAAAIMSARWDNHPIRRG